MCLLPLILRLFDSSLTKVLRWLTLLFLRSSPGCFLPSGLWSRKSTLCLSQWSPHSFLDFICSGLFQIFGQTLLEWRYNLIPRDGNRIEGLSSFSFRMFMKVFHFLWWVSGHKKKKSICFCCKVFLKDPYGPLSSFSITFVLGVY